MTVHASQPIAPAQTTDFASDRRTFVAYWDASARLIAQLPPRARRSEAEQATARSLHEAARAARVNFLRAHVDAIYDLLTDNRSRFVRVQHLVTEAADAIPGLVPSAHQIAAEDGIVQRDKEGLEIDQGLFISAILGSERSGRHLCHAMLLARPEAHKLLPKYLKEGHLELAGASVTRHGKAALVTLSNPRFLNA